MPGGITKVAKVDPEKQNWGDWKAGRGETEKHAETLNFQLLLSSNITLNNFKYALKNTFDF